MLPTAAVAADAKAVPLPRPRGLQGKQQKHAKAAAQDGRLLAASWPHLARRIQSVVAGPVGDHELGVPHAPAPVAWHIPLGHDPHPPGPSVRHDARQIPDAVARLGKEVRPRLV